MEQSRRVLIVAESERLRHALSALFAATPGLGAEVETGGVEALEGDHVSGAAVVLLVGKFPGMNLARAVGHVREKWPGARLLVLAEDAAQWREAKDAGADRVHFKGIAPEKLVRAIQRLLEKRGRYVGTGEDRDG
ncbi:hypothetical protein ACVNPS_05950 [Candidatus Bipolaricaulota sp. J31]